MSRCVLVLGGSGFLGSVVAGHLARESRKDGSMVIVLGRSGEAPGGCVFVKADVRKLDESWFVDFFSRFRVTDVVNCVGVVGPQGGFSDYQCNAEWVEGMVRAANRTLVSRVVYISALGVSDSKDDACSDPYFTSRQYAEKGLLSLDSGRLWYVLRPSVIYDATCYGGSEALRCMAGAPGVIPMPGGGKSLIAPVSAEDVAACVSLCLFGDLASGTFDVVGPEVMTVREYLRIIRGWLGFGRLVIVPVPWFVGTALGRLGSVFPLWGLNPGVARLMRRDYISADPEGRSVPGFEATEMERYLACHPAKAPERWHARVGFIRPFLALAVAVLWAGSAWAGLRQVDDGVNEVADVVKSRRIAKAMVIGASAMDAGFAVSSLGKKPMWGAQFVAVVGYTVGLGLMKPSLWKGLYGPLLKNIPIIGLLAVLKATESRRG